MGGGASMGGRRRLHLCARGVSASVASGGVCVCKCRDARRHSTRESGAPSAGAILQIKNTNPPGLILPEPSL